MVVFICDSCQETLSRAKIKLHQVRCRNCWIFSCVDCGVQFNFETFDQHVTCITESQKYTGKKEKKKDSWAETILQAVDKITDQEAKEIFEKIISKVGEDVIPKKKPKFFNLCKSCFGFVNEKKLEIIWIAIDVIRKEQLSKQKEEISSLKNNKPIVIISTKPATVKEEIGGGGDDDNEKQLLSKQVKSLKKKLKKTNNDNGLSIRELAQDFGDKKTIKKLVRLHPDLFLIEKSKEENSGRFVKLQKISS